MYEEIWSTHFAKLGSIGKEQQQMGLLNWLFKVKKEKMGRGPKGTRLVKAHPQPSPPVSERILKW